MVLDKSGKIANNKLLFLCSDKAKKSMENWKVSQKKRNIALFYDKTKKSKTCITKIYLFINPPSIAKNYLHRERVEPIGPYTILLVEFNEKSFC